MNKLFQQKNWLKEWTKELNEWIKQMKKWTKGGSEGNLNRFKLNQQLYLIPPVERRLHTNYFSTTDTLGMKQIWAACSLYLCMSVHVCVCVSLFMRLSGPNSVLVTERKRSKPKGRKVFLPLKSQNYYDILQMPHCGFLLPFSFLHCPFCLLFFHKARQ